jgi:hypothetical protein
LRELVKSFRELLQTPQGFLWLTVLTVTILVGGIAYMTVFKLFSEGMLLPCGIARPTPVADFVCYYLAGILAQQNFVHPVHIYDTAAQLVVYNDIIKPNAALHPLYCPYPPYFFLLMTLLVTLSLHDSFVLFNFLGLVANLVASYFLFKPYGWKHIVIGASLTIFCFPTWQGFLIGNTSIFLFPAACLYAINWKNRNATASCLSLIPYLFKFQYMPLQLLPAIASSRWRLVTILGASFGALMLLSMATLGLQNVLEFPKAMNQTYTFKPEDFQNLRGQLVYLPFHDFFLTQSMSNLRLGLAFIIGAWFWFKEEAKLAKVDPNFEFPCFSLLIIASAIVSPYTFVHDYSMLLLPCAWIWSWSEQHKLQLGKGLSFSLIALTMGFPALSWVMGLALKSFGAVHVQPFTLWAELLIILTLVGIYRVYKWKLQQVSAVMDPIL